MKALLCEFLLETKKVFNRGNSVVLVLLASLLAPAQASVGVQQLLDADFDPPLDQVGGRTTIRHARTQQTAAGSGGSRTAAARAAVSPYQAEYNPRAPRHCTVAFFNATLLGPPSSAGSPVPRHSAGLFTGSGDQDSGSGTGGGRLLGPCASGGGFPPLTLPADVCPLASWALRQGCTLLSAGRPIDGCETLADRAVDLGSFWRDLDRGFRTRQKPPHGGGGQQTSCGGSGSGGKSSSGGGGGGGGEEEKMEWIDDVVCSSPLGCGENGSGGDERGPGRSLKSLPGHDATGRRTMGPTLSPGRRSLGRVVGRGRRGDGGTMSAASPAAAITTASNFSTTGNATAAEDPAAVAFSGPRFFPTAKMIHSEDYANRSYLALEVPSFLSSIATHTATTVFVIVVAGPSGGFARGFAIEKGKSPGDHQVNCFVLLRFMLARLARSQVGVPGHGYMDAVRSARYARAASDPRCCRPCRRVTLVSSYHAGSVHSTASLFSC